MYRLVVRAGLNVCWNAPNLSLCNVLGLSGVLATVSLCFQFEEEDWLF